MRKQSHSLRWCGGLNHTRRATLGVAFLCGFQPFAVLTPVLNAIQSSPAIDSQTKSEADRLDEEANRLFAEGKLRAAAQMYRRALDLAPGRPQFHFNLALALGALGDQKAERQELNQALFLDPSLAAAHNQLGLLATQVGDTASGEREFQMAIAVNPKYGEALNNLGVLYLRRGNNAEAVAAFRQAAESDPKSSSAYVNLALALIKQKGVVEAESNLLGAIQQNPNNAGAYIALGVVRNTVGKNAEAVAAFRKAVELQPESSDAHLNLGMALVLQFDRKNGLSELMQSVRLNPDSAAAHLSLGHFYFETGRYGDARKEFEIATRLQPTLEDGFYFWALTEWQSNNNKTAAELLEKAVALNPENADTQFLLGQSLAKLGRTAEAIEHWKCALRIDPNQSQAMYSLARNLNRAHDPEAQRYQSQLQEFEERERLTDQIELLRSFALQAGKAGNWPQAIEQLQQALQLCKACKDAALLHKNLAFFYEKTGRINEAERELEKTLAIDPQDTKAQQALAQVRSLLAPAP